MSSLVGENPSSPNAIPARSSSTGVAAGSPHPSTHGGHFHQPSKSVLIPLPEESWISPKARQAQVAAAAAGVPPAPAPTATATATPRPLSNPQLSQTLSQLTSSPPQAYPRLLHRSSSIGKTHSKHLSGDENATSSSMAYRTPTKAKQQQQQQQQQQHHHHHQQPGTTSATGILGVAGAGTAPAPAPAPVPVPAASASATTITTARTSMIGGDRDRDRERGERERERERIHHNGEWNSQKEKIILGPYDYLEGHPGKDIRSQLIRAFDDFLKVPPASLAVITRVVGMLHTSSLLIDDVQDNSTLRRGVPVAHNIFGTAQTINSANYVYFLALKELQRLSQREEAIEIFTSELLNLHRGQGMDLYWRDTLTCPSEDDYLEMVQNKTGGLFRLAVRLMQAESTERGRLDCVPLANLMGLVFQICDDHLNLSSTVYTRNKGLCEDLTEGKFSFPVIHAIHANPGNLQLLNILKLKTTDDQVKMYAVRYMQAVGSFDYSRKVVRELKAKAARLISEMDAAGGVPGRGDQVRKILERMEVD